MSKIYTLFKMMLMTIFLFFILEITTRVILWIITEKKEVLKSLKKNNCVISLGGGAFINEDIRNAVLKNAISIWLDIDLKTLNERIKWSKKRPLLNNENSQKKIDELYSEREKIYKLANYKIECGKLDKENIAKKVITFYEKY